MKNEFKVLILTVALVCLSFAQASAAVIYADNSAANVEDTSLFHGWTVASNAPGAWSECYAYDPAGATVAMIKFNTLPSIPAAWVTSAKLVLYAKTTAGTITVASSAVDWNEATLEWANWGDVGNFPHGGTPGTLTLGVFSEIDVTAIVTAWLSGSPNYGMVITGSGGTYPDFRSSEDAAPVLRPQLKIEFTAPGRSVVAADNSTANVDDVSVHPSWAAGTDTGFTELYHVPAVNNFVIRFNTLPSVAPDDVIAANLSLLCKTGTDPLSLSVHEAPSAWNPATIVYPGFSPAPAHTHLEGVIAGAWTRLDVTDEVKGWLSGSPNNGMFIEAYGAYGEHYSSESGTPPTLEIVKKPPPAVTVLWVR